MTSVIKSLVELRLGGNVFRFIAIAVIIALTLRKIKREGSKIKGKLIALDYS